jgi:hypothetical protein
LGFDLGLEIGEELLELFVFAGRDDDVVRWGNQGQ